jgi:hypothetical protein
VPERLRTAIEDAVSRDFVVATRAVLVGMTIALGAAFLVALLHPGGRPRPAAPGSEAAHTEPAEPAEPAA